MTNKRLVVPDNVKSAYVEYQTSLADALRALTAYQETLALARSNTTNLHSRRNLSARYDTTFEAKDALQKIYIGIR